MLTYTGSTITLVDFDEVPEKLEKYLKAAKEFENDKISTADQQQWQIIHTLARHGGESDHTLRKNLGSTVSGLWFEFTKEKGLEYGNAETKVEWSETKLNIGRSENGVEDVAALI